jgi:hypothetical protein
MLSEILFASVDTEQRDSTRPPGLSCSQLFPCAYRLWLVHTGQASRPELTPQQVLNMADGWDQEIQSVRRLAEAGIRIEDREPSRRQVVVGKSNIPGSIDGTVVLNGTRYLWEHKAWNERSFSDFLVNGLKYHLGERCQINAYMLGKDLEECIFYVKYKDGNDYSDRVYKLDRDFIDPIIEWADKIRLENWEPEPEECDACKYCGVGCFGEVLDFSWIGEVTADEMVEKWKKGKQFKALGEMLIDEARTYFVGKTDRYGTVVAEGIMGDRELLRVGDLEIKKITSRRFDIDAGLVLKEFGPEGLMKVGKEKYITSYRFREVQ